MNQPADDQQPTIASRTIRGSALNIGASLVTFVLGFARAVLLARLLLPEHYGVVTIALFYLALTSQLQSFGFDYALLHHQEAGETVRRTYLSLRLGLGLVASALLLLAAPVLALLYPAMAALGPVTAAFAGVSLLSSLSAIQETFLSRQLAFRQLAQIDVVASLTMTLVAPSLAFAGWGVWALVAEQASGIGARFLMGWLVFRPWRPRLGWHGPTARWFWDYGKPAWGASSLHVLIDRFDDFWIGTTLGQTPLGYYSRAYEFAHYPRRIITNPLITVFNPVFARLQDDRLRLSRAFYRAAYVILRSSFLLAGAFALVMPEFILLVIGPQWLPMLFTARLMLVYMLIDSLLALGGNMLLSTGHPAQYQRTVLLQALIFIPAVILGAALGGINGVAIAANLMLLVGGAILFTKLRPIIDFSLARLVGWPLPALLLAYGAGIVLESALAGANLWLLAIAKLTVFSSVFGLSLLLLERDELLQGLRWMRARIIPGAQESAA